jgi:hypothetical protein
MADRRWRAILGKRSGHSFQTGAVGALALSGADPNVLFDGLGETKKNLNTRPLTLVKGTCRSGDP